MTARVINLFGDNLAPILAASIELERYRKREKHLEAFFGVWDRYVANDASVSEHDVAVAMQRVRYFGGCRGGA